MSNVLTGNVQNMWIIQITIDVALVATITAPEQTFTVQGLALNDFVYVNKGTPNAGLGVAGARVSAPNTLAITFVNPTIGAIDPIAQIYTVLVVRPDQANATTLSAVQP